MFGLFVCFLHEGIHGEIQDPCAVAQIEVLYSCGVGNFTNPGSFPLEAPGNGNSMGAKPRDF